MKRLRNPWTLLWEVWPTRVAAWLNEIVDRKTVELHRPEMVPADDTAEWPDGVMPWCRRCGGAWPCKPYAQASDRVVGEDDMIVGGGS